MKKIIQLLILNLIALVLSNNAVQAEVTQAKATGTIHRVKTLPFKVGEKIHVYTLLSTDNETQHTNTPISQLGMQLCEYFTKEYNLELGKVTTTLNTEFENETTTATGRTLIEIKSTANLNSNDSIKSCEFGYDVFQSSEGAVSGLMSFSVSTNVTDKSTFFQNRLVHFDDNNSSSKAYVTVTLQDFYVY
jgi:hypothetical protein